MWVNLKTERFWYTLLEVQSCNDRRQWPRVSHLSLFPLHSPFSILLSVFSRLVLSGPFLVGLWRSRPQYVSTHTLTSIPCHTHTIYIHCICICCSRRLLCSFLRPHALSPCSSRLVDARRSSDQVVSSLYIRSKSSTNKNNKYNLQLNATFGCEIVWVTYIVQ